MSEKNKELTYTVTEEEYRAELASGLTEDEVMKPGRYKVIRNRFRAKPGATDPKNCKVKITTYLDADVLEFFKKRAAVPNAAPYQTQINNELRKVMEASNEPPQDDIKSRLLENGAFLRELKERLSALENEGPEWSKWKAMPRPEKCRDIAGPAGPGVYQVRNRKTGTLIMFGHSETCQSRMKSLFPAPWGTGTRNSTKKRAHILENWRELQYRTLETSTVDEARQIERKLKAEKNHLLNT